MKKRIILLLAAFALFSVASSALASRRPLAIFLNTHIHSEGIDRILQLEPGLIRLFLGDWKSKGQIDRLVKAIDRLESLDARILVQINLLERPDNKEFNDSISKLAERLGDRVTYWQLGNESDSASERYFPLSDDDMQSFATLFSDYSKILTKLNPEAKVGISISTRVFEQAARTHMLESLVKAFKETSMGELATVDIHWHREYPDAEELSGQIARIKSYFSDFDVEYLMTESNTFTQTARIRRQDGTIAKELGYQSEEMQASYGVRSVFLGCAASVSYVAFGYPVERENFGAKTKFTDHPFAMNGLWYSNKKDYGDGKKLSGPKKSAFSYWLLSRLFTYAPVKSCKLVRDGSDAGIYEIDVQSDGGNYKVVWTMAESTYGETKEATIQVSEPSELLHSLSSIVSENGLWPPRGIDNFEEIAVTVSDKGTLTLKLETGRPMILLGDSMFKAFVTSAKR